MQIYWFPVKAKRILQSMHIKKRNVKGIMTGANLHIMSLFHKNH